MSKPISSKQNETETSETVSEGSIWHLISVFRFKFNILGASPNHLGSIVFSFTDLIRVLSDALR